MPNKRYRVPLSEQTLQGYHAQRKAPPTKGGMDAGHVGINQVSIFEKQDTERGVDARSEEQGLYLRQSVSKPISLRSCHPETCQLSFVIRTSDE